jgi:glycerophosphoryl diester phosphodiesterase
MAAIEAALGIGAGIECDVRLSGDGQVMIVHDHELGRLCGSPLLVERTPAEQLAALRLLGTAETIPWLGEALDLVRGAVPLLVEVKVQDGNARAIADAVIAELADYAGPVGVMSFDPRVASRLAMKAPYRRRGLVVAERSGRFDRWTALGLARPHFVAVDRHLLGTAWAARVRRKKWLYSWTVRTAHERAQAEVHADALIWEADGRG